MKILGGLVKIWNMHMYEIFSQPLYQYHNIHTIKVNNSLNDFF